jgi:putative phosphoribosyl transferase
MFSGEGFADRLDAGRRLADALRQYVGSAAVVLGMARGGVEVGAGLAEELHLPLRALVVRKLGAPQNPELALGAVSETGVRWLDPALVRATGASEQYVERISAQEEAEARRRRQEYAVGPGLETVRGCPAIVVDDGIATGASALVAVRSVRGLDASEVILAVPVASRQAVAMLRPAVDRLVVLDTPDPFFAVGLYYRHFDQVSDAEVVRYLKAANPAPEERS